MVLQNLEALVDRPLGQPVPDAYGDDAVEPAILCRRRLEKWRDPQIVVRCLDHLPASNAVEHLLRAMAQATVGHADDLIIVRLKHDAHVKRPRAVAWAH